jgi:serine phosphatase RsbU (regulator of sigma subunit)
MNDPYDSPAGPVEEAGTGRARRLLPVIALASLLLFAGIAGALSWRQYRDAQRTALNDARSRAAIAAIVFDTYFDGEIATLSSIANAPAVVRTRERDMLAYFKRVQAKKGQFDGGLAWIDRAGRVHVSTNQAQPGPSANVSDRSYFATALRTGEPFVSEGLTSRTTHRQVVVTAVPTRNAQGRITGVLAGTELIKPSSPSAGSIDLGFGGLAIIDRRDQSVLAGFVHPRSLAGVQQFGKARFGVLADTTGLDGNSGHVLAYARARVPQWTVILDRPRSEIFASARRSLAAELILVGGAALIGLALLAWVIARERLEAREQREAARRRRLRYEQEHRVATTLQRSLLSGVPQIDAVDSAARYQAGSTGLEVGGDWYDVLRRPDGVILVTVGDVAGRGVAAAALMGQLRNAFRAYAYDHSSPAEIMWRLIRHMGVDQMATAVCIAIDPHTRELTYASAGHPPALLRDDSSGVVTRLDLRQAPPLGFVSPEAVHETRIALPRYATLLAYTDGVIERRGEVIDEGIERLESAFRAADRHAPAAELADTVIHDVAEVTAADDDIAVLVMRFLDLAARFESPPEAMAVVAQTEVQRA